MRRTVRHLTRCSRPPPNSPTGSCATTRKERPSILWVLFMADTERKLANGKTRIDFQTDPSRYRHWKLAIDGEVATLTMDVDEKGGLYEGYDLKINSCDLVLDIELGIAFDRLSQQ